MNDVTRYHGEDEDDFRPSAARLVDSLRDTGYLPEAAFADVIDNSIAANATRVRVELSALYGEVRVVFLDNGDGMDEAGLRSAMRYGSPKRPDPKSLGKFGMGLKTASTAFCERLTVISLKDGVPSIRAWDMDTIRQLDKWVLETPSWSTYAEDRDALVEFAGAGRSGTMVIWEKVDRLVTPGTEQKVLGQLEILGDELCEELSAMFARFLDRSNKAHPDVAISVVGCDGSERHLQGWDPLCLELNSEGVKRVKPLPLKTVTVTRHDGSTSAFTVAGGILPPQNSLSAAEQKQVRYSLDNQGIYIYREGRLIWHEGWPPRMYKKEGKMTRLRVVLDFGHELDDVFSIDFRKSRIIIPQTVRQELQKIVAPWRNHVLKEATASGGHDDGGDSAAARHLRANNAIGKHSESTKLASVKVEGGEATLQNKYNRQPVRVDGVHIYSETGVRVREEDSLEGNVLWAGALDDDGEVCVQLGRSHPYFARMYAACKDKPEALMAIDMLLWACANAEIGIWSEQNKGIIRDFRMSISSGLNILCQELPDPSDD